MKKILALALSAVLCLGLLAGCGEEPAPSTESAPASDPAGEPSASGELEKIIVGATSTPHGEVLEAVRGELEALGYELQLEIFNDYVLPTPRSPTAAWTPTTSSTAPTSPSSTPSAAQTL